MTAKDTSKLVIRLLGLTNVPPHVEKDLENLMELILATGQIPVRKSTVKEEPNNLPPEDNTINMADIDHFDMPKELNLQLEGEEAVRKIKIFPDGVSEAPDTTTK